MLQNILYDNSIFEYWFEINMFFYLSVQYRTILRICMEAKVDRRQKKSREAIFKAFTELLSKKHYNRITVGEIIEKADIGRATFYAHFETKDFLLKELCEELFCHVFDVSEEGVEIHRHIFVCDAPSSAVLHLLQHFQRNDNKILDLMACENNELFLRYFREELKVLIRKEPHLFGGKNPEGLPEDYWIDYLASTLVETIRWWIHNQMKENPQAIADYFNMVAFGKANNSK